MAGEPRNAASEWFGLAFESLTGVDPTDAAELLRGALTERFVYEDRRLVAMPGGDVKDFVEHFLTYYEVGEGPPRFVIDEVVAVRGESLALVQAGVSYESDWDLGFLLAIQCNGDANALERAVSFGVEDRAEAVEEIDRLHAELEVD